MPIQQGLHHHHHVGLGDLRGRLQQRHQIELLDRAVNTVQPAHDRGRDHLPDTVVDRAVGTAGRLRHLGQACNGLLDEDIARPEHETGRLGPRHHLHR